MTRRKSDSLFAFVTTSSWEFSATGTDIDSPNWRELANVLMEPLKISLGRFHFCACFLNSISIVLGNFYFFSKMVKHQHINKNLFLLVRVRSMVSDSLFVRVLECTYFQHLCYCFEISISRIREL